MNVLTLNALTYQCAHRPWSSFGAVPQSKVRAALNTVRAAQDRWKAQALTGRQAATSLTNDLLTERFLPDICSPVDDDELPGLKEAGVSNLRKKQLLLADKLRLSLEGLREASDKMRQAAETLAPDVDDLGSMGLYNSCPVFGTAPLCTIGSHFKRLATMYEDEQEVKDAIYAAFMSVIEQRQAVSGVLPKLDEAEREGERRTLEVLVTAWLLHAKLDEEEIEQTLLDAAEDMKGF